MKQKFPDFNLMSEDMRNSSSIPLLELLSDINEDKSDVLNRKITELKGKDCKFFGYDADGSDAPALQEYITAGRANAQCIRFLYASDDKQTAIMEVGAKIGQPVSVAMIELLRDIKVLILALSTKGRKIKVWYWERYLYCSHCQTIGMNWIICLYNIYASIFEN